jgi:hypothetical protein
MAYYIDFGVSHINDRTLEAIANPNIVLAFKTVASIFFVLLTLYLLFSFFLWFTAKIGSNLPYLLLAICLLCFGMIAPFKEMEIIPFKNVNLFWHLASLATSFWLFNFVERIAENDSKT